MTNSIEAVATQALADMFESGRVKELITEQLDATIKSIINSSLRDYSPFGKALAKAIEAQMPTNFDRLDLSNYNDFVVKAVSVKINNLLSEDLRGELDKMLDSMMETAPAEMKVSQLAECFIKYLRENEEREEEDEFTFIIDESNTSSGYFSVYFDKERYDNKYRCAFQLHVTRAGEVYSAKIDGEEIRRNFFHGPHYGMERTLMQLYYGKTKLIKDVAEVEQSMPYND